MAVVEIESIDVVELILDAAEDCFATIGVRQTTIDSVAVAAGVSRVTVYRRIGTRDELVLRVLLRITERFLRRIRPRLVAQPDLEGALALLVRDTVRAARRDDLRLLFASEERGATGAPLPGALAPLGERFGATVDVLVERFPGQLRSGLSTPEVGEWVLRIILSLATIDDPSQRSGAELDAWVRRFALAGVLERSLVG